MRTSRCGWQLCPHWSKGQGCTPSTWQDMEAFKVYWPNPHPQDLMMTPNGKPRPTTTTATPHLVPAKSLEVEKVQARVLGLGQVPGPGPGPEPDRRPHHHHHHPVVWLACS